MSIIYNLNMLSDTYFFRMLDYRFCRGLKNHIEGCLKITPSWTNRIWVVETVL